MSWPKEYGGRGATVIQQHIFNEEIERVRVPMAATNFIGIAMVGPIIIHWGTEEHKKRLPAKDPQFRGDMVSRLLRAWYRFRLSFSIHTGS